jgi:hypothetical protein
MKNIIFSFLMLASITECCSQTVGFKEFTNSFKPLKLPIENIMSITGNDTLNGKFTNDIIIRSQVKKPQFIDKNGNSKTIEQYYGLYPEEPFKYGYRGEQLYFYNKIIPIGRIELNPKYESLIIKVVAFETTFYDLWNFSKDGKALSVVCLFWGLRDAGPRDEKVTFTIVDSKITKEGNIIWHENADGLETFRTYKLNEEGYFQVIKEEQKGEAVF